MPDSANGLAMVADKSLGGYKGFIVGEFHDVAVVPGVKLALIKYLHETRGVNDVFMEIGYSAAWLYNRYLATGDTTFITQPPLVYNSTAEGKAFWLLLYAYNQATGGHIAIHGIDFERMEFVKAMRLLEPQGVPKPDYIANGLHYIDTLSLPVVNSPELANIYNRIKRSVYMNIGTFSRYYGDNFNTVSGVLYNKCTYEEYHERDKAMYGNAISQLKGQGINNFVLFTGKKHCDRTNKYSLCSRLMKSRRLKGQVIDIVMVAEGVNGGSMPQTAPGYINGSLDMGKAFTANLPCGCNIRLLPAASCFFKTSAVFPTYLLLLKL
jgi:hypothetical protein